MIRSRMQMRLSGKSMLLALLCGALLCAAVGAAFWWARKRPCVPPFSCPSPSMDCEGNEGSGWCELDPKSPDYPKECADWIFAHCPRTVWAE